MLRDFFRSNKTTPIDVEIEVVLQEMHNVGVDSDRYDMLMTYLERLNEIKVNERQDPVSRNTIALIVGNLLGIALIVVYEQKNVITSKAFSLLPHPK